MKDNTMYSKDINHSLINSNRCCMTHVQYVCAGIYMTGDFMADWGAERGGQSPVKKKQFLVHQTRFKSQWKSLLYSYMTYSTNFSDALSSTQIDRWTFRLVLEKSRNLLQAALGPNHTSGLTLISVSSPVNSCTKHWSLWLEVKALWSYWAEKAGLGSSLRN